MKSDGAIWAGGKRWRRVAGTSTVLGFHFNDIMLGKTEYIVSAPIAGALWLSQLQWESARTSLTTKMHRVQLAFGDKMPVSGAEMDSLEQVFPDASIEQVPSVGRSALHLYSIYRGFRLNFGRVLYFGGRRLVVRYDPGDTFAEDVYVALIVDDLVEVRSERADPGGVLGELQAAADQSRIAGR